MDESVPAHRDTPASCSRESASEPRGKVISGMHSNYTHFPKDRNCDICLKTKISRAPCRKHTVAAILRAENVGDLTTANHKVLGEGCEFRNNHRYVVVVQDLATQWIQSYPCKTKTSQEMENYESSWSRRGNQKSFTLTIPKNLANLVNTYLGIIARQHLTIQKQMVLLRERYAGSRMGALQYCCNQVWMNFGGRVPWCVTAICETYKISCLMGRRLARGDPENGVQSQDFHQCFPHFLKELRVSSKG